MNQATDIDWHLFFQSLNDSNQDFRDEPVLPHSSILLLPFALKDDIDIGGIHISKSESVQLAGSLSIAYLSSVTATSFSLPGWLDTEPFCHPLAQALAISLTFVTGYRCGFAANTPNYTSLDQLTEAQKQLAGLELPLITSGNCCNHIVPSDPDYEHYVNTLRQLTLFLKSPQLEPGKREQILRSMELLARAISLQKVDHGLALSLTVAAIEAAADAHYADLKPVEFLNQQENGEVDKFKSFVHSLRVDNADIYRQHKSALRRIVSRTIDYFANQFYSTRKFIRFVERYAPYATWDSLARHPYFDLRGGEQLIHPEPPWSQRPSGISEEGLERLLKDTYGYRSKYVHCALQPPGAGATTTSTYFEKIFDWNSECETSVIKLSLLFGIARKCLLTWLVDGISINGDT
jgi:hypothetical protein